DFIYVPDVRENRVFVLGEVVRPGVVPFREELHIVEALAQVGYFTDRAQPSGVYVVRGGVKQPQIVQVDIYEVVQGKQRPLPLQRDDIVFVSRSLLGNVNRVLTLLTPSLQAAITAALAAQAINP